jgi:hypothetical protein
LVSDAVADGAGIARDKPINIALAGFVSYVLIHGNTCFIPAFLTGSSQQDDARPSDMSQFFHHSSSRILDFSDFAGLASEPAGLVAGMVVSA